MKKHSKLASIARVQNGTNDEKRPLETIMSPIANGGSRGASAPVKDDEERDNSKVRKII